MRGEHEGTRRIRQAPDARLRAQIRDAPMNHGTREDGHAGAVFIVEP